MLRKEKDQVKVMMMKEWTLPLVQALTQMSMIKEWAKEKKESKKWSIMKKEKDPATEEEREEALNQEIRNLIIPEFNIQTLAWINKKNYCWIQL